MTLMCVFRPQVRRVIAVIKCPRRYYGRQPAQAPILPSPLVPVDWLAANRKRVAVFDGSWHMPSANRSADGEYEQTRITGAFRFDIDVIKDVSNPLPHMIPHVQQFNEFARRLKLNIDTPVVVYDTLGVFSAPRVWLTFKSFGATDVGVLDGGLRAWTNKRLPCDRGAPIVTYLPPAVSHVGFVGRDLTADTIATYADMKRNVTRDDADADADEQAHFQVIDARSQGRFAGTEAEPRAGLRSGHIPGSINVPYAAVVDKDEDGNTRLKPVDELKRVFESRGVDLSNEYAPIVTTCGSGVMASTIKLCLELIGFHNVRVYDGSWTEYAAKPDAIIATHTNTTTSSNSSSSNTSKPT